MRRGSASMVEFSKQKRIKMNSKDFYEQGIKIESNGVCLKVPQAQNLTPNLRRESNGF